MEEEVGARKQPPRGPPRHGGASGGNKRSSYGGDVVFFSFTTPQPREVGLLALRYAATMSPARIVVPQTPHAKSRVVDGLSPARKPCSTMTPVSTTGVNGWAVRHASRCLGAPPGAPPCTPTGGALFGRSPRRWLAAEYVGCRAGRASQAVGEARVRRRREAKELARRCPTARPHGEPHIFHKSTVDRGPAQCFSWRHRAERYQKSAFHVRRLAACAQRCAIQALRAPAFTAPAFTRRHGRIPLVTHLSCRGGLTIGAFTAGTCCASARK